MKKLLFVSLFAVLFAIAGCNSNDDKVLQDGISGTTWLREEKLGGHNSYQDIYSHLELQSQTFSFNHKMVKTYDDGSFSENYFVVSGKYRYEPPKLILTFIDDYDNRTKEIEFVVFKNFISNSDYGSLNKK